MRCFDHIDLRVRNLAEVQKFYEILLPALGFNKKVQIEGWLQYERTEGEIAAEFFGITESPGHIANECRIAFWAPGIAEVNKLAEIVRQAGARNIEGPAFEVTDYYAVFFEDASGNHFEICYRE
jgi:predicted enzyme related to lactoylglutathione lyase